MATKHPNVFCRLETKDRIYNVTDYEIHMERQRPILGKFTLEEPLEKKGVAILQLGYLTNAYRITALKIDECSQIAARTFDVLGIEPSREMLDIEFIDQFQGVDLIGTLKAIASRLGLRFRVIGDRPVTKSANLYFLGTIRNALDQIWTVFNQTSSRWFINQFTRELVYMRNGKFETEPTEIPMDYFKEEFNGGLSVRIVPMFRPHTPVIWRGEEQVIDIARLDSRTRSMYITFAEAT